MATSTRPTLAAVETLLRDGYWDRTEIIKMADGSMRVRKQSKGQQSNGPWGQDNLRAEALYIQELEPHLLDLFPRLIASWEQPAPGYDMAYMTNHVDVAQLARKQVLTQQQADEFQNQLGKRVFGQLHTPYQSRVSLADNVISTLKQAAHVIEREEDLTCLTAASMIINSKNCLSLSANTHYLNQLHPLLNQLDAEPQVRLHGDLFLENILLPAASEHRRRTSQIVLIDPVSVAGVTSGHPLFDLAKYESYANGELPAMRRGHMLVEGMDFDINHKGAESITPLECGFNIDWQHAEMLPFKKIDWHAALRKSYVTHYGPIDQALYALLEAYFAAAMVLCTNGVERRARALKATLSLQNALSLSEQ